MTLLGVPNLSPNPCWTAGLYWPITGCYPYLSWIIPTHLDEHMLIRLKRT
jgi:hypothetical protein